MKNYRTGIVGTTHLDSHLFALNTAPRVELVAAVAQTEAEKEQFGASGIPTIYSNYEEMFANEDLDIVELDTDPTQRYEITLVAAERGIHVLGEKPIAASLEHADEMVSACNQAGVVLAIHNLRRCDPYHIRAKTLLEEGFFGDLLTIRTTSRNQRSAGHCLISLGSHLFDITRFFGGDVDWLFGHLMAGGKDVTVDDIEQDPWGNGLIAGDKVSVMLGFKNGRTAMVEFWMAEAKYFGIELIGTKGAVTIRQPEAPCPMMYRADALWPRDTDKNPWQPMELPEHELAALKPDRWDVVYRRVVEEFVRCIETGDEHPTSGLQALKAIELVFGTYESHRHKARVALPLAQRKHPLEVWLQG